MADFDLVVLGAGPGGYVAAIRAAQLGLRTAVVERDRLGGVCGNWGCIPSKAILSDAALYVEVKAAARRGIVADGLRVDYPRVIARSREVADQQAKGVEFLFKKNQITMHQGRGRLVQGGVVVTTKDGETRLAASRVLLATGSVERVLPGMEVDGEVVCTSREALARRALPASVVIIGGGAVGVEFAYAYRSFGAKVAVVEMADQLLPGMDTDLGAELAKQFARQGIEVFAKTKVTRVSKSESGGHVGVDGAGGARTLDAAMVLVAVGRAPNVEDLGLEALRVQVDRGRIVVGPTMETSVSGVWAIGDLVGQLLVGLGESVAVVHA
jgi:dihydrolipoamide dehydrogenase